MPRLKSLTLHEARNVERARRAWQLRVAGASPSRISKTLSVSVKHVYRLLDYATTVAKEEAVMNARAWAEIQQARCESVMLEASHFISARCNVCDDNGMALDDKHLSVVCWNCGGTKYRYSPEVRLRALDNTLKAIAQLSGTLGIGKGDGITRIAFTDSTGHDLFRQEVESYSDEELTKALIETLTPQRRAEISAAVGEAVRN